MTDVIRFPANVPAEKWPDAHKVFVRINAGDWAGAQQAFDAAPQNVKDAMGAVEYWYEIFRKGVPVVYAGRLVTGIHQDIIWPAGTAKAWDATAMGTASGSIQEGGTGLYGAVFDHLPDNVPIGSWQTWGKVAVNGLILPAGSFFVGFSEALTDLPGRVDVR
jgi:hypothetical protein